MLLGGHQKYYKKYWLGILVSDVKSGHFVLGVCFIRLVSFKRNLIGSRYRLKHHGPAWLIQKQMNNAVRKEGKNIFE